jgi:hypothetical protein
MVARGYDINDLANFEGTLDATTILAWALGLRLFSGTIQMMFG